MPSFEQGDIVRVPFPYTDRATRQARPAVVVSHGAVGDGLLWVVMVTSAENRAWIGDIPIADAWRAVGLPAPSIIRPCKIATVEVRHVERRGRLTPSLIADVKAALRIYVAL